MRLPRSPALLAHPHEETAAMLTRREANAGLIGAVVLAATPAVAAAADTERALPPPRKDGGKPLMQALQARRSTREYADRTLPAEMLSDLLWAAYGTNRPSGDRTAPYWRHIMVIDVYAAMADGVWLYDPKRHVLVRHSDKDIRGETGQQEFVASAPLNLIYAAHGERMKEVPWEARRLYASVDTGFIGQNVYLYCASEGLATVFRGAILSERIGKALGLGEGQFVTFCQSVGYPKV
jgi:nitroreductase